MLTIQDYLHQQKAVERSIHTLNRRLRQAFDAAQTATTDGRYDCLDKLAEQAARDIFKDNLYTPLVAPLAASIAAMPEEPFIAEAKAMGGFYGLSRDMIIGYVDGAKEQVTFENFWKFLTEKTAYKNVLGMTRQAPLGMLDKISVADVAAYVGLPISSAGLILPTGMTASRVIKKPELIDLHEKAALIDVFEQTGVIPPKYLEDKSYMK